MSRKRRIWTTLLTVFLLFTLIIPVAAANSIDLDTHKTETGVLAVNYELSSADTVRLMLEQGDERVFFRLPTDRTEELIPLTMGNGTYQVTMLEQISGNQYRPVHSETVDVMIEDSESLYLESFQEVRWDEDMAAVQKAGKLTEGLEQPEEKVEAIYEFVVTHIAYDYDKALTVSTGYLPDIDEILEKEKGICYDYASLFAGMLRSQGVPTRLVKGYAPGIDEYHAWNEVKINGAWHTVDTTADAVYRQAGHGVEMLKDGEAFDVHSVR